MVKLIKIYRMSDAQCNWLLPWLTDVWTVSKQQVLLLANMVPFGMEYSLDHFGSVVLVLSPLIFLWTPVSVGGAVHDTESSSLSVSTAQQELKPCYLHSSHPKSKTQYHLLWRNLTLSQTKPIHTANSGNYKMLWYMCSRKSGNFYKILSISWRWCPDTSVLCDEGTGKNINRTNHHHRSQQSLK